MKALGEGGWTAIGAASNIALVLALIICIAESATVAGYVIVPTLILLSGYAQWRADAIRRKEGDTHGH